MPISLTPLQTLALLLAILAIGNDLYARRVPNTVLLGTLAVAGLWQVLGLLGWVAISSPSLVHASLALVVGLAAMLPFYVIGWMGAGDVKLVAVLGFLLGLKPLLVVWVIGNLFLGVHTTLILATRLAVRSQPQLASLQLGWQRSALHQLIQRPRQGRKGMPYAAYLGMGVFIYVFAMPLLGVAA